MKKEVTEEFADQVLKLGKEYKVKYCVKYTNIEILNLKTQEIRFINIHEFIHTHCTDYLLSYANGLKITSETNFSEIDKRIIILHFSIFITVPNLIDGQDSSHVETFSGLSELILYIKAVEWLIKYRKDNPKLSKFWINKF